MSALSAISLSCCSDIVHLDRFYRLQEMFRVNIKVFKDRDQVDIIFNEFVFVLAIYGIDHQVAIVPFLHFCNLDKAIRPLEPYSPPVKGEGYVTSVIRQDCLRIDHIHNIHYSIAKDNLDWLGFACVSGRRDNRTCASWHSRAQKVSLKLRKRVSRQMSLLNLT